MTTGKRKKKSGTRHSKIKKDRYSPPNQVIDGDLVLIPEPEKKYDHWLGHWSIGCCDCGLFHDMYFRIVKEYGKQRLICQVFRDQKSTDISRKHEKYPCKKR